MLKLFRYLTRRDWSLMGVSFGFILLQIWLDLALPDYMSEITNLVQTPDSPMSTILSAGGKMILCAVGSLLSAVIVSVCIARIAAAMTPPTCRGSRKRTSRFVGWTLTSTRSGGRSM